MKKTNKRDAEKAYRVQRTADIHGLKPNTVYKILREGPYDHPAFITYMELRELDKGMVDEMKLHSPEPKKRKPPTNNRKPKS